jgi:hypothetical protein
MPCGGGGDQADGWRCLDCNAIRLAPKGQHSLLYFELKITLMPSSTEKHTQPKNTASTNTNETW